MKKIQSFAPLVTTALLMSGGAVSAALTVNESFDYDADPLAGANGGTGWAGAWGNASTNGSKNVTVGSLISPTGDDAVGNKASLIGVAGGSSEIFRTLSSSLSSGTVYVGFTFSRDLDSIRTAALSLYSASGEEVLLGIAGTSDELTLVGKDTANVLASSGIQAVVGTTYQIVLRIDFNASGVSDALNMFVNQDAEGTADASVSSVDISTINKIRLFAGSGNTTARGEASFDEIRIGSEYADVVAVPEPSSFFLISLTGMTLLSRRRRSH